VKTFTITRRPLARRLGIAATGLALLATSPLAATAQHEHGGNHETSTPAAWSCETAGTPATGPSMTESTPMMNHGSDDVTEAEFDQMYIDMMVPHHGSIIALSQAALPHLTDPRLQEMAQAIIDAQTAENAQLSEWREEWYGAASADVDDQYMMQMLVAMPVGTMDEMMQEMDAAWQVSTFCAAENPDVAFIQQAIRHHQMAIDASMIAVEQAAHPELAEFAQGVIEAQQAEIDTLNAILEELEAA